MDCTVFFSRHLASLFGTEIKVTLDVLSLDELECDVPYQRELKTAALKRMMADDLNPVAAGFLVVNKRRNGKTYLVDGNHRRSMLESKGLPRWPCMVTHGLTEQQEAELWQAFNGKRSSVHTVEKLNAQICAREKEALELREVVHRSGFRFPFDAADASGGDIVEIKAIESIQQAKDLGLLDVVLGLVRTAWPGDPDSVGGLIIKGVVTFLRSPGALSRLRKDKLVKVLAAQSPKMLLRDAKCEQTMSANVSAVIAQKIALTYNKGLPEADKVKRVWRPGLRVEDIAE